MRPYKFNAMRTAPRHLPPGTPEWCEGMSVLVQSSFSSVEQHGARELVDRLQKTLPHEPWRCVPLDKPAGHPKVWLEGVTGPPWLATRLMVEALDEELACRIEQLCGRAGETVALAESVAPVAGHGGAREQVDISENINLNQGGTSASYRVAKLKRDAPEVAERMAAGEFRSVADAERAAGLRAPKQAVARLTLSKEDPEAALATFRRWFESTFERSIVE